MMDVVKVMVIPREDYFQLKHKYDQKMGTFVAIKFIIRKQI